MTDTPEITITVHGPVGIGKSAVALAILHTLRSYGMLCEWPDEREEIGMGTQAGDIVSLERKPRVHLVETNPSITGSFDLVAHLHRQRAFSERAFGPGARTAGVLDHIRKELTEVEADPGDVYEWVDLVILALDGAWRAGHQPQAIVDALVAKQTKNEGRTWPDWRTADPTKAIEHDRSGEAPRHSTPMPIEPGAEPSPALEILPPLKFDSTPEEVTAHFNAVDAQRAARAEESEHVDGTDDPEAMAAALLALSEALEAPCNVDDMLAQVDRLQRNAEDAEPLREQLELVRARATESLRMLWLLTRFASGGRGLVIDLGAMMAVDWSRAALARDDQLAGVNIRLRAVDNGSGVSEDAVREFAPKPDQHAALHAQLLDMLGAKDHNAAAGRIGGLVGLERVRFDNAGRGVTAIAVERRRQIEGEKFDPQADLQYTNNELASAASCYVWLAAREADSELVPCPPTWPWARAWWKPKDRRSNLVRAGALIAAELDRLAELDRVTRDDDGQFGRGAG